MSSIDSDLDTATLHQDGLTLLDPRPITVAVNPVALVVTECITVTSAMRKHARWAHSSVAAILGGSSNKTPAVQRRDRTGQGIISGGEHEEAVPSRWGLRGKKGKSMQDNPLMSAFARLRNDLKGCKGAGPHRTFSRASLTLQQTSGPSIPRRCCTLSSKSFAPRPPLRRSRLSLSSPLQSFSPTASLAMTLPVFQKLCSSSPPPSRIVDSKQVIRLPTKSYSCES